MIVFPIYVVGTLHLIEFVPLRSNAVWQPCVARTLYNFLLHDPPAVEAMFPAPVTMATLAVAPIDPLSVTLSGLVEHVEFAGSTQESIALILTVQ